MRKVKVLQVVNDLDGGGVERLLLTYLENSRNNVHFDFLKHVKREGILEKEINKFNLNFFFKK